MTRRLLTSAALGAITATAFGVGFLLAAAPLSLAAAAYLRRIESTKTSSTGEVQS